MLEKGLAALLVVDVQDKLAPKKQEAWDGMVANIAKLIEAAHVLHIPVLVTEQYPEKLGATTQILCDVMGDTPRMGKVCFSCFGLPEFSAALKATGRSHLIITGMETRVCVMQTALDAIDRGLKVFVPTDAVTAQDKVQHKAGLRRMEQNGAQLVTTQMALFELLRAAGTPEFKSLMPLLK
jgi:nicotinamidase-related amidase